VSDKRKNDQFEVIYDDHDPEKPKGKPKRKPASNTGKIIALVLIGLVFICLLGTGAGVFSYLYFQAENVSPDNPSISVIDGETFDFNFATFVPETFSFDSISSEPVYDLAWSPDGNILAVYSSSGIRLHRAPFQASPQILDLQTIKADFITFSPDGSQIAAVYHTSNPVNGQIAVWNVNSGEQQILQGKNTLIKNIAFNTDGTQITTADNVGNLLVWDIDSGEQINNFTHNFGDYVDDLAFNSNGQIMLAGRKPENGAWLASANLLGAKTQSERRLSNIEPLAQLFSENARYLAILHQQGIEIRNPDSEVNSTTIPLPQLGEIYATRFNDDSSAIGLLSRQQQTSELFARVWNIEDGNLRNDSEISESDIIHAAFDSSLTLLATADRHGVVKIWNVETGVMTNQISYTTQTLNTTITINDP
jgi:WD40 repeat protein